MWFNGSLPRIRSFESCVQCLLLQVRDLVLMGATLAWMTLSVLLWEIRKRFAPFRRRIVN
jgi:hypothetical protein